MNACNSWTNGPIDDKGPKKFKFKMDYLRMFSPWVYGFLLNLYQIKWKKHSQGFLQVLDFESGAYENRTHDLLTASQTL